MALPTLEKTWQHNVNQSTTTSGTIYTDLKALMYKIKASLVGFASSPWTVVRSSNGVVADASDNWASAADVIWVTGSNRSWIVLQQSGLGSTQICISCSPYGSTNSDFLNLAISPSAGFTGGSITARPTATDERVILSDMSWITFNSAVNTVLHVMMSSTGEQTRILIFAGSTVRAQWFIEKLADSSLTYPVGIIVQAAGYTLAQFLSNPYWFGKHGAVDFTAFTATESYGAGYVVNVNSGAVSNISGGYPMTPLSLHSETPSAKGRAGRLVDMWAGSSSIATGSTYPVLPADTKEFFQFNQFVFPWNGSTPVIT